MVRARKPRRADAHVGVRPLSFVPPFFFVLRGREAGVGRPRTFRPLSRSSRFRLAARTTHDARERWRAPPRARRGAARARRLARPRAAAAGTPPPPPGAAAASRVARGDGAEQRRALRLCERETLGERFGLFLNISRVAACLRSAKLSSAPVFHRAARASLPPSRRAPRRNDASSRPSPSRTSRFERSHQSRAVRPAPWPRIRLGPPRDAPESPPAADRAASASARFTRAVVPSARARVRELGGARVAQSARPRARRAETLHGVALGDERGDAGLERRDAIRGGRMRLGRARCRGLAVLRARRARRGSGSLRFLQCGGALESLDVVVFPVHGLRREGARVWRAGRVRE